MFKDVSDFLYVLNADSGRYADAFVSVKRQRRVADRELKTVLVSWLAISNDKILVYFSKKIYGSNFIKQHSETVMV